MSCSRAAIDTRELLGQTETAQKALNSRFKGYILGLYWVYIGIMENKMQTTRVYKDSIGRHMGLEGGGSSALPRSTSQ